MPHFTKLAACLAAGLLIASSLCFTTATAATAFPRGCAVTGYGFVENDLVINEKGDQSYYLIQNRSDKKVELEHYEINPDVFMSPKLEVKFDTGNWSAFASDVINMHFRCYTQANGDKMIMSCRDALDVCQYPRVKFALSNMGNYWISTNKPLEQVIKDTVAKGIYLRW